MEKKFWQEGKEDCYNAGLQGAHVRARRARKSIVWDDIKDGFESDSRVLRSHISQTLGTKTKLRNTSSALAS